MTAVISSELTSGVQFISGLRRCCGNVRQRECTGNALRWAGSVVPSRRGKGGREGQELAPVGGARVGGDLPESVCPERGRVRGLGVSGV